MAGVELLALIGLLALFGLSAEDLLLKPGYSRLGRFEFLGEFGDLSLLTANGLLEALSLVPPSRFSFGGPGMLRPPVVCLLAKLDSQATDFGVLNKHASMVRTS